MSSLTILYILVGFIMDSDSFSASASLFSCDSKLLILRSCSVLNDEREEVYEEVERVELEVSSCNGDGEDEGEEQVLDLVRYTGEEGYVFSSYEDEEVERFEDNVSSINGDREDEERVLDLVRYAGEEGDVSSSNEDEEVKRVEDDVSLSNGDREDEEQILDLVGYTGEEGYVSSSNEDEEVERVEDDVSSSSGDREDEEQVLDLVGYTGEDGDVSSSNEDMGSRGEQVEDGEHLSSSPSTHVQLEQQEEATHVQFERQEEATHVQLERQEEEEENPLPFHFPCHELSFEDQYSPTTNRRWEQELEDEDLHSLPRFRSFVILCSTWKVLGNASSTLTAPL